MENMRKKIVSERTNPLELRPSPLLPLQDGQRVSHQIMAVNEITFNHRSMVYWNYKQIYFQWYLIKMTHNTCIALNGIRMLYKYVHWVHLISLFSSIVTLSSGRHTRICWNGLLFSESRSKIHENIFPKKLIFS